MWGERPSAANAVIVGAFLAALAGISVLAWAVASPGPDDATTDDHLVYLLGWGEITVVDPETRETVQTIATEYDPEITIAPDGTAIYLTDGVRGSEMLSVIDTRTWQVVDQLPAPDRINNIPVGSYGMAVSADGQDVYIHKWKLLEGQHVSPDGSSAPRSDHWWDIYDTTTREFSDNPPHVPACGIAEVFPPLSGSTSLAVLCYQRNVLVFLDLQSGEIAGSIDSRDTTNGNVCARGDTSVAAAVQAPDGTIFFVTTEGCVRVIDPVEIAVRETFSLDIPADRRILYSMVTLSPSGDRLVLGVIPGVSSEEHFAEAWVIDVASQSLLSTIPLEPGASSLAISPDGALLYAVSQEGAHEMEDVTAESGLSAIDIATGREVWHLTDLNAPEVVRVAPRP